MQAPSPDPFRFKVSASLVGQEKLLRELLERASPENQRDLLNWYGRRVQREAKNLVPRETGELEEAIDVQFDGDTAVSVGVPASSPAIEKAHATEYGTWNYSVGEPASPKRTWAAKSKMTATMPWLRTAAAVHYIPFLRKIRRFFITGRREP